MSYTEAIQTYLLATHCCACNRPLCDAVSVEMGMGPICRKAYMVSELAFEDEAAHEEANRIVYEISLAVSGSHGRQDELVHVASGVVAVQLGRLRELGYMKLAAKLEDLWVPLKITAVDDRLELASPYDEAFVVALRRVPGRRWDSQKQVNTFPASARRQLWMVLCKFFAGCAGVGPRGGFVVPADGLPPA